MVHNTHTHTRHTTLCDIVIIIILTLQGFVANFVETEQLVTLDGGRVVASYVQV